MYTEEYYYDYLIIPITGSDLVSFESSPSSYQEYVDDEYNEGWEFSGIEDFKDVRCLVYKKKID